MRLNMNRILGFLCIALTCSTLSVVSLSAQSNQNAASFPGADASIKINACIAAVINAGGGTCDASALGGKQTMSEQINLGSTAAVEKRAGVTLLLPDAAFWSWHLTDGTSCGIKQFSSTSLLGHQPGGGGDRMVLQATSGSRMDAIYCTDHPSNGANYLRAEGFSVWNNQPGSEFKNGVIHIMDAVDQSSFSRIMGENYYGDVWHIESACCGVRFESIHATSNGSFIKNGSKGGIPLTIGPGKVNTVSFYDSSVNQPGNGFPDVFIRGGGIMAVNFFNLYMEGNGGIDPKTPMVYIAKDTGPIHFIGGIGNTEQGQLHETKPIFENHGLLLDVHDFEAVSTTIGIVDVTAGVNTPTQPFKGNLCSIPAYRTKYALTTK
jgi:hypothetical protein